MGKNITVFLSTSPYFSENTLSTIRIAEAALRKGHSVSVVVSADGIYCFLKQQKAVGLPNAEEGFRSLIQQGLKVYL